MIIHTVMLHNGVWLIILYNVCNLYRIVCIFKFLHKPSVLLHSVCSFAHIYYLFCPINHDLRYFVAKFICCNLRAFRCKFFLPKSCLCKENDKYQVWLFVSGVRSQNWPSVIFLRLLIFEDGPVFSDSSIFDGL